MKYFISFITYRENGKSFFGQMITDDIACLDPQAIQDLNDVIVGAINSNEKENPVKTLVFINFVPLNESKIKVVGSIQDGQ